MHRNLPKASMIPVFWSKERTEHLVTARIYFSVKFHLQHGGGSISMVSLKLIKSLTITSMK